MLISLHSLPTSHVRLNKYSSSYSNSKPNQNTRPVWSAQDQSGAKSERGEWSAAVGGASTGEGRGHM